MAFFDRRNFLINHFYAIVSGSIVENDKLGDGVSLVQNGRDTLRKKLGVVIVGNDGGDGFIS